jgi:DNA-binding NarL/FixJ family response regulator
MGLVALPRETTSEDAWAELRAGRWSAARAAFERSLESAGTPEAWEGLSWAAWWLDDAETVFDARSTAYRLYRERGEAASAARLATWLASDELDFHGAASVASGWLARARRLLEPLEPGPDHGWLAFHEGYVAHVGGDLAEARRLAAVAAEHGRRLGVVDLEMLGLALEGAALVASAQVVEGMRSLDEATATALEGEAEIPISAAWACCFLVSACTAVRDFGRAAEWCDRIAEFAERFGSRYMLAFCRAEYGAVHLWRGRWQEAEEELEAAVDDFARSRPAWAGGPLLGLAELRRRQGRVEEADGLLERAGGGTAAQVARARLALDRGDARRASELLERVLRQAPAERALGRVPSLELLVRARIAGGELDAAAAALDELRALALLVGTEPLAAAADVAEGVLESARGEHERARALLDDAVDAYERHGAPYEAALTRVELAASLTALGREEEAQREVASAVASLRDLGASGPVEVGRGVAGPGSALTPREREVLLLVADGLTNRQIAERLVVSEHTVHRHVTNILRKLDLPTRTAAAAHAVRTGLAGPRG